VVNLPEKEVKFSRITEFKKFYNTKSKATVICKETFRAKEEPCYPVMNEKNRALFQKYKMEAGKLKDVTFIGRLAKFTYLNMDQVIEDALRLFEPHKTKK